ncbi:MbtH family protein [Streptomyces sp. NPDC089922]|uniref:MbtH family protein n=1 Tax=unclassified Streptomyces TaxID=2593676 RepID=UPI00342C374E
MRNTFDDEGGRFLVLGDGAGRPALWPAFVPVPQGWRTLHGPAGRADCLEHVARTAPAAGVHGGTSR